MKSGRSYHFECMNTPESFINKINMENEGWLTIITECGKMYVLPKNEILTITIDEVPALLEKIRKGE